MAKILITDDDRQVRALLRILLGQEGHETVEAADGCEALAACRRETFDLLLCDLFMPKKEGLETIREVKRAFPNLKVMAMSGGSRCGRLDALDMAQVMGADAVLRKPYNREKLFLAIEHAITGRDPTESLSHKPLSPVLRGEGLG